MCKKKRMLSFIMAGMMVFGMVGCGSSKTTSSNDTAAAKKETAASANTTTETSSSSSDAQTVDTSEHVKVKFIVLGNKPTNGRLTEALKLINEKLTEKINAELEVQYVEWADWQTQYNLLLASGDSSIDLITTATDWLDAWPNVKKGSFLPLSEDMLKTYAPQTWESVSEDHWNQCKYEDQIYLIPEDNYAQYTNHGFFYRGDWAKEAGLGDINNFEDMGKYFQYIKENKDGVIPWDVSGTIANANALVGGYINSTTNNIVIDGVPVGLSSLFYGASKDDIYTLSCPYVEGDTLKDFAKMMKQWADSGYWREDVLNYSGETRDLFYAGQSGADQHHSQTFYSAVKPSMDEKQPGSDAKMFPFCEPSKNLVKLVITHGALAVGANSKHPERALMVYDLLRNDEEIYRLYNYGIEGTDYIITDDGKLGRPDGWDSTKDSMDSNFWCGRNDKLELNDSKWWDGKDDMIANYNSFAIDYPYGKFIPDTSNIEMQITAMSEICANYIPLIAFGKVDDAEATVDDFRNQLKAAGYQDVFDELQNQLNEFKASQN